jgi:hypothetical protein
VIETAEYGPFTDGYVASVDRSRIGRKAISEDSRDVGIDPQTFAATSRPGSAVRFDTAGALVGLLEAKWNARVRQFLQFESDSFQDGEPNIMGLWSDETDKEGQVWWRSSNGADSNQVVGKSYGTTHRSKTNVTVWNFLMIPLATEHATDKWTRCKSTAQRKVVFSGSRKVMRVGKGLLAPNKQGTPVWWNGRFNDSSASGSEREYIRPLGPMGPIFPIRRTGVSAVSAGGGTWVGADTVHYGYCYQFENGEFSDMYISSVALTVDVGTPAGQFDYVSLFVPPGPPDCIARYIFRTNKWPVGTPTSANDPRVLLYSGVILNNYQTAYDDFGGDDDSLRDRPDIYRADLIMPPRASSVCTMDGRVVFFDLKINRSVIQLAPYSADSVAVNLDNYMYDQAGAYGNTWFYWRCDGTNLTLKHNIAFAAATTDLTVALAGKTLKGVVDTINAVVPNVGVWTWRARLLPGVDGNEPATSLETTNAADYFDDDAQCNDGTVGNQRVICGQTLPGVLAVSNTSLYANAGTDPRALHFTLANPAATGTAADAPLAPNAWRGGYDCRRRLEGGMGRMVGGCTLLDGCLVLATNGIGILRNTRGGKTGVDSDYRLEVWKRGSGVIAWGSHAEGDGWGVYTERQGLMVNDGKREVCISGRVWNSKANNGAGMGPWAYEFTQCKKWVGSNLDDGSAQFHVSVGHGRIYVFYRSSASVTYPDMYMYYDYTASQDRLGVDQVLRVDENGDQVPFPWSAPFRIRGSQLAVIARSDGEHVYTAPDDLGASHSTGDGTCVEIELQSSNADDGVQQSMTAYLATDRFDAVREKKRVSKVDCEYYDSAGVLQLSGSIDFARATSTAIATLTAISDGTIAGVARLRTPAALRGPANTLELKISGAAASRAEIRRLTVQFRRLKTTAPAL